LSELLFRSLYIYTNFETISTRELFDYAHSFVNAIFLWRKRQQNAQFTTNVCFECEKYTRLYTP